MKNILSLSRGRGIRGELIRGGGGLAFLKVLNMLLMLIVGVLFARTLGPENYGIYAFLVSIITLLSLPAKAGLPTLLVREIAYNQQNKKNGLIRGLLSTANYFSAIYSMVTVFFTVVVIWVWKGDSAIANPFYWALCLLPLIAFEGVRIGALRGFRLVLYSQLPELLVKPLIISILLGAALFFNKEITLITAIQFNVLATFSAFIIGVIFLAKMLPLSVKNAKPELALKSWGASLLPLTVLAGLKMLDSQVSILLLGWLASDTDAGLFKVAASGSALIAFALTASNMVLAPHIARLFSAGEVDRLQRLITVSVRVVTLISLPIALVLIVWGEVLITWIFGVDYKGASTALAILCLGQLVNVSAGSVVVVLNMTGHDKKTLSGVAVALFVNILSSVILIPYLGVLGAAISYSLSMVIWNIILIYETNKHTGIKTSVFS